MADSGSPPHQPGLGSTALPVLLFCLPAHASTGVGREAMYLHLNRPAKRAGEAGKSTARRSNNYFLFIALSELHRCDEANRLDSVAVNTVLSRASGSNRKSHSLGRLEEQICMCV